MWSIADYPPGTELPAFPAPDLTNFPRWLRPVVGRRFASIAAHHQGYLEEVRQEYFSRPAGSPPRLVNATPFKMRGRRKRQYQHWTAARHEDELGRWDTSGGGDKGLSDQ
jgi:hypothetical protein